MIETLRLSAVRADPIAFWIFGAVVAVLAVIFLRRGLDAFWRLRTVADTPTARIRSATQGYVELCGRALAHNRVLTAPLTRLPCVWYRFKVQERRRSGKNDRWVTIDRGEAELPFVLEDDTGRCLVEPAGADVHSQAKDTWYGSARHTPRPRESGWLQLSRRYRFTEERILRGEPLYLLGRFETPRRGVEEREGVTRHLLARWKQDPARMARFDANGDGEISLDEWESAREEAQRLAAHTERRLEAEPPLSRLTKTDDPRRPFVISTFGEGTLIGRLRWRAAGATIGFVVLGCGLTFAVVARLAVV
ncbi:MAG: GIDE domain-containing protein [Chromatiaceae bacterium]